MEIISESLEIAPATKWCNKCKEPKGLFLFGKDIYRKDGLAFQCRECLAKYTAQRWLKKSEDILLYQRQYRKKNQKELACKSANYRAKHHEKFLLQMAKTCAKRNGYAPPDISAEELKVLIREHSPLCDMKNCKKEWDHFDHCHDTGKTRGFLCRGHNLALGGFHDSTEELKAAIEYLEFHKGPTS